MELPFCDENQIKNDKSEPVLVTDGLEPMHAIYFVAQKSYAPKQQRVFSARLLSATIEVLDCVSVRSDGGNKAYNVCKEWTTIRSRSPLA